MKRLLSLMLALFMLLCTQSAFAAPEIEDTDEDFVYYKDYALEEEYCDEEEYYHDLGDIRPGHQMRLFVCEWFFEWDDYSPSREPLKWDQPERQNLTIGRSFGDGSDLIYDITWKRYGQGAYIQIDFATVMASVQDTEIAFTIWLSKDGERLDYTELEITALMRNPTVEVDHLTKSLDLSKGAVARVRETVSLPVYAGAGLTLTATLQGGRSYYAQARLDTPPDEDGIRGVYVLYQSGFSNMGKIVSISPTTLPGVYDVYDANREMGGKLLGLSTDILPVRELYVFYERTPEPDPEPTENPASNPTGGGDTPPSSPSASAEPVRSTYFNPATGR